jgi:MFS family permease
VWRTDAGFRRYESFFLVFGFANIMSIPLTQIHAVDVLGADYLDMALINVVLVQGTMAATLAFWGRCVDRYPPTTLRGLLNLIFAIDFLAFALAPSLGWIFLGRVFRGVALGGGTLVWMLGSLYYARNAEDAPIYLGIHTFLTGVRWALAPFAGVAAKALAGDDARPVFFLSFVVVTATGIWMLRTSERAGQR